MEKAKRGEVVEGLEVFGWDTQAELAETFRITPRHVQNLEKRGLPAHGDGPTKRYPWPHAGIWFAAYKIRTEVERLVVERLPFAVALAEHRLSVARMDAEADTRVRRRGAA